MEVEEDGDEIFTPMPAKCLKWYCQQLSALVLPNYSTGNHECTNCHGSYGRILKESGS